MISLDQKKFNVTQTAPNGVVNHQTIFCFSQAGEVVTAQYEGGRITRGFLVGKIHHNAFDFSYCQLQDDGKLDHGSSACTVSVSTRGKIQIIEDFEWGSRPDQKGQNIFQEL